MQLQHLQRPLWRRSRLCWGIAVECRSGCGACCIAPSINVPIPGMPKGKPAGVRCVQLDHNNFCLLFGLAERPVVCAQFKAEPSVCGDAADAAIARLTELELLTLPE